MQLRFLQITILVLTTTVSAQQAKRPTVGIALEGGGAFGLAHVGVLEFLEEQHIPIDFVAGTSMGGLVGGLYAMGKRPVEIRTLMNEIDWAAVLGGAVPYRDLSFRRKEDERAYPNRLDFGLRHGVRFGNGFNSGQQVAFILDDAALPYYKLESFDQLPIPFRCVATDLNTGAAHVFKDGSLPNALRSTMSIPALFSPVKSEGAVFADGGLLNNLPVDIVRAMGADIVIAVYLKEKLYDSQTSLSIPTLMGRTMSIMIAANEKRNMEAADILVTVDLSRFTSMQYSAASAIADQGYEGSRKKSALLNRLAVDDASWQGYVAQRDSKRMTQHPNPTFVRVTGASAPLSREIQRSFAEELSSPIDRHRLERRINRLDGSGRYAGISYGLVDDSGKTGLLVKAQEKDHAPPFLDLGFTVDGSDYNNARFGIAGRVTVLDLGGYRSEWRTDVTVFSPYGLTTEYYHPFTGTSKFFVAPRFFVNSTAVDLYRRRSRLAEYRFMRTGAGLDLGYAINPHSELRLGYESGYIHASRRIGDPLLPEVSGRSGQTALRYSYDGVDAPVIPRSGHLLQASLKLVDSTPGSDRAYPVAEIRYSKFTPLTARAVTFASSEGGTDFGRNNAGLPEFFLGGPFKFSAYGSNELVTNQYVVGRLGYLHKINNPAVFLGEKLYAIAYYELGKVYGLPDASRLPMGLSAGLIVETFLGPVLIGAAAGDSGHAKVFFKLGRLF